MFDFITMTFAERDLFTFYYLQHLLYIDIGPIQADVEFLQNCYIREIYVF